MIFILDNSDKLVAAVSSYPDSINTDADTVWNTVQAEGSRRIYQFKNFGSSFVLVLHFSDDTTVSKCIEWKVILVTAYIRCWSLVHFQLFTAVGIKKMPCRLSNWIK